MKYFYRMLPVGLGFSLIGCGSENTSEAVDNANDDSTVDEFFMPEVEYGSDLPDTAPVLKVSTAANNPPFEFKDEYGNPMGFDIDIIKAIGAIQGFKVQINNDTESNLLLNLEDDHRDIVIAGLGYDDSLSSAYGISDPYHFSSVVMTYLDSEIDIDSKDDLKDLTLGIIRGTKLTNNMLPKDKDLTEYETPYLAIQSLVSGDVDAVAASEDVIRYSAREIPGFSPSYYRFEDSIENIEKKSIYVAKEDTDLLESINAGLKEIVRNGNYGEITVKWLAVEKSREYNERFTEMLEHTVSKNAEIDETAE